MTISNKMFLAQINYLIMTTKIEYTLEIISKLKNGEDVLDGYMEGDIVELFEILSKNNKHSDFIFLALYIYKYNKEILKYMNELIARINNRPPSLPYSNKPYCDIIEIVIKGEIPYYL
jgi:hypothetical protein